MTSTADPTDDSPGESTSYWPNIGRRPLLKALGIGAALLAGSDTTAASEGSDAREGGDDAAQLIHPVYGYPTMDADAVPEALSPDHEIELHRDFPEDPVDPDRPSFFHFEPTGIQISAGDIVQFTYESPNHTITPYHPGHGFQRRVPEAVPPFSSPLINKDGAWLYQFEHEGLYDLFCGVHEVTGMVIRLVVGDFTAGEIPEYADTFEAEAPLFPPVAAEALVAELEGPSELNENVEWTWLTAPEVLSTEALDPMNIQEAGPVSFEEVADELGVAFEPEEDHESVV